MMKAAQIALVVFFSLTLLSYAHDHGKPQTGNDNFWTGLVGVGIIVTLIYFAGGFSQL
jgi:LPXTG-motif cell wall-anchored protein